MKSKNLAKFYLISTCLCLSTEFAFAKAESIDKSHSIATSIDGMKALNSKLSPHDITMKNLIIAQEEKDAVLSNIDDVLNEKNRAIFEYMKLTKSLKSKVDKLTISQKIKGEFKKREISSNIEDQDQRVAELKGEIIQKDLKIQFLKKSIKNQNIQLTQKIQKLNFKIKNLSDSFNKMPEEMEKIALITESKHIEEIRNLQNQLHNKSMTLVSYQEQLQKYKEFGDTITDNKKLAKQLEKSNDEINKYKISYKHLQEKLSLEIAKNNKLEDYAQNIKNEYSTHINLLKKKYSEAITKVNKIESKYFNKGSRMPASVAETDSSKFETDLGYVVEIDPRHLKIILDESFFFKRGDTSLSDDSKQKLQTIMNAYSEQIFGNDKLRERLENIHIIGHSSPIYKGVFVEPVDSTKEAYQVNMDISLMRAKSIVNIIIDENTKLSHRSKIREKLIVSGKSFSEPMPLQRGPASVSQISCGSYDCEGSQRVELIFELEKQN